MPAYVVYRPSVMRSGRLAVRAAAVAALLAAAAVALVVLTHSDSASPSSVGATPAPAATHRAKPHTVATTKVAKVTATARATVRPLHAVKIEKKKRTTTHARVPAPAHTPVAVLNGGTSQGAAAAIASRLRTIGYPVPVVGNAGRRDLPSVVEYSAGFGAAARALAKHVGPVRYVTPFDGPDRNLSGAHLLVIVGSG